jgi:tellurite resistance protein TerC
VIVLRGIMIALARPLVAEYHWVLYIFAAFLIFTGIKMLVVTDDQHIDMSPEPRAALPEARLNVTEGLHGSAFFVQEPDPETGKLMRFATPLFLALVMVEIADLVFAVDSVPASSRSPPTRSSSTPRTSSPSSACARCISRWRRSSTASTI